MATRQFRRLLSGRTASRVTQLLERSRQPAQLTCQPPALALVRDVHGIPGASAPLSRSSVSSNLPPSSLRASICAVHGMHTAAAAAGPSSGEPTVNPLMMTPGPLTPKSRKGEEAGKEPAAAGAAAPRTEFRVSLKRIPAPPKKLNLACKLIRGLTLQEAKSQCQLNSKRVCAFTYKLLRTAESDAVHNFGIDPKLLYVAEAYVGKGRYLKRITIHAKGRSGIRRIYQSHLFLKLSVPKIAPDAPADARPLSVHPTIHQMDKVRKWLDDQASFRRQRLDHLFAKWQEIHLQKGNLAAAENAKKLAAQPWPVSMDANFWPNGPARPFKWRGAPKFVTDRVKNRALEKA